MAVKKEVSSIALQHSKGFVKFKCELFESILIVLRFTYIIIMYNMYLCMFVYMSSLLFR